MSSFEMRCAAKGMVMIALYVAVSLQLAGAAAFESDSQFPCAAGKDLPPMTRITVEEAEERECCIDLPCKYNIGCWADQMPPLYSAPRSQALTKEQSHRIMDGLVIPISKTLVKTFVSSMPEHGWHRVPVPLGGEFEYFYDGIKKAFEETFHATLKVDTPLDLFHIEDFDARWANDATYESGYPGAGYWIHNDCSNFRICYEESGYQASDFTGDGTAFVLPVSLPSSVDFRDGHVRMPAALELYNISHGFRDEKGKPVKPSNRQWMQAHRYNLGEIIFFNAFRWHSGHVPKTSEFIVEENDLDTRTETVGFAAKHKEGFWVLFRMCKGSTDDNVTEKILATDLNPNSNGASTKQYDVSVDDFELHNTEHNTLKSEL